MLGKPGSISLLSGSIVGPVEDRQIYRRKGLEWGMIVKLKERQHNHTLHSINDGVPSPDQGIHMLDGQSNHNGHVHSIQKLVRWLNFHQKHDSQHHHQPPNTEHQFVLPRKTVQ